MGTEYSIGEVVYVNFGIGGKLHGYISGIHVEDQKIKYDITMKVGLVEEDLLNEGKAGDRQFFVSDYTDSFEKSTQIFFGETIKLTQFPIWD